MAKYAKPNAVAILGIASGYGGAQRRATLRLLHTLQLLANHASVARGNDMDKLRNLAKSVTVE